MPSSLLACADRFFVAMEARDRPAVLELRVDLLTRGSQTDDIGLWMSRITSTLSRTI